MNRRTWAAFLACAALSAGCNVPRTIPADTPSLVTYEDGSNSAGYCTPGALCDASGEVTR